MKIGIKIWLLAMAVGFGLRVPGNALAQTFRTLYSFPPFYTVPETNSDGVSPSGGLLLSGAVLYGAAKQGGSFGQGNLFKINTDGTGFTNLHSFTGGSDGANPSGDLILSRNALFGTAAAGGIYSNGTVFALNTDGTGFKTLHNFAAAGGVNPTGWVTNSEGVNPGALVLFGSTLYGAAQGGGSAGWGTVFAVNIDGTGFKNIHVFKNDGDGAFPVAGLLLSGDVLYGSTTIGGSNGPASGSVFAVRLDGTGFTTIYAFTPLQGFGTNSDGGWPTARLIASGNTLYGTAYLGGATGNGTVFVVNADGPGFTNLHSFAVGDDPSGNPTSALLLLGNTLYGTAVNGGHPGIGSVFGLNTDGTHFTNFYSFKGGIDGAYPRCDLVLYKNILYGTSEGSVTYNGTVFGLSFQPQLSIVPSGANIILSWPTNYSGFDYAAYTLQSTRNLAAPVWTANFPAPVVVNGQKTVTTPISGTQQFFRLSQ